MTYCGLGTGQNRGSKAWGRGIEMAGAVRCVNENGFSLFVFWGDV